MGGQSEPPSLHFAQLDAAVTINSGIYGVKQLSCELISAIALGWGGGGGSAVNHSLSPVDDGDSIASVPMSSYLYATEP